MFTLVDSRRRWARDLAALRSRAIKAGLENTSDSRLAEVLRDALAACEGLLYDLDAAFAERSRQVEAADAAGAEWIALFERLPCPCVCTDVTGVILDANPAAAELLAISARHLDTRLLTHFTEDRVQFARALRTAAWDRDQVRERMIIRPRDRAPVPVEAVVFPKSRDDNSVLLWFLQPLAVSAPPPRRLRRTAAEQARLD